MNRTFNAAVAALIVAVGFAGSVAAGSFEDRFAPATAPGLSDEDRFAPATAPGLSDLRDAIVAYNKGDYATALRLMPPLAEQGDSGIQVMLGDMYALGQGVPQDYTAAIRWYRKAAKQGDPAAQFELGRMYYQGKGAPQNYAVAMGWFRKAAEQGNAYAQTILGTMYGTGDGVPEDFVIAHMWLNLAAVGGDKTAVKVRNMTAKRMTPAQIAEAQKLAREWKPKSSP